jgi:hypothetical protein
MPFLKDVMPLPRLEPNSGSFLPPKIRKTLLMEETASSPDENPFPEQELHWRQPKVARPGKGRSRNIKN